MKFVLAVVMLVLAVGAQASVWPHAPAAVDVSAWGAPGAWAHGAWPGAWGGPGAWAGHGGWAGPAWGGAWPGAGIWTAQGGAASVVSGVPAAVHAAAWPLAHEGTYVAKTRGAVHTAPLAGHANSATSINVAPAPGTV